jgi:quinol monooxygenase YgiN
MTFVMNGKWTARAGHEDEVREHIRALVEPSRAEPGNLLYLAHEDPEDPRVFVFYEQYVDEDAFRRHGETEHFQRHGANGALPLLDKRERHFLRLL